MNKLELGVDDDSWATLAILAVQIKQKTPFSCCVERSKPYFTLVSSIQMRASWVDVTIYNGPLCSILIECGLLAAIVIIESEAS